MDFLLDFSASSSAPAAAPAAAVNAPAPSSALRGLPDTLCTNRQRSAREFCTGRCGAAGMGRATHPSEREKMWMVPLSDETARYRLAVLKDSE